MFFYVNWLYAFLRKVVNERIIYINGCFKVKQAQSKFAVFTFWMGVKCENKIDLQDIRTSNPCFYNAEFVSDFLTKYE